MIRREARVKLAGLLDPHIAMGRVDCSPCLMRDPKKMPANHRHKRHHRHGSEEVAYLSLFFHDDGMTLVDRPPIHRHVENPIGIRKSTSRDAYDGDDDELQRLSKWGVTLCYEVEKWCDEPEALRAQVRKARHCSRLHLPEHLSLLA